MAIPDLQQYQLEIFVLDKHELDINVNCFFKLYICCYFLISCFICNNGETRRNKNFSSQKSDGIFIFDQIKVSMVVRCKSGIAIFAWRVPWNYAYSPLNNK